MTCQRALSLIEDYVDNELVPAEAERVAKHLDGCHRCRKEFRKSRRLRQLLRQMPGHDPGRDYWQETARLVQARTTDVPVDDRQRLPVAADSTAAGRAALARALVSLAASLTVLVSAILLGAGRNESLSRLDVAGAPVLATAPVSELLGADGGPLVTRSEQIRLAKGMLLMGAPGFLGRFTGLPDVMVTAKKR